MARDSATNYAEARAALQDDCGIGDPTLETVNECLLAGLDTYSCHCEKPVVRINYCSY